MRHPTIDQYIDTLSQREIFTRRLSHFSVPNHYNSGNFGVVFKIEGSIGECYALKCFTCEQVGRREAYMKIARELPSSDYLVSLEYLEDEILVAPHGMNELIPFDVIRMEYVDGVTLSEKIAQEVATGNTYSLKTISQNFDMMAIWLLGQKFAHGDIKPDNIIVQSDLSLKLIDYDGVFVESMEGENQRECGTQIFQHPLRSEMSYCKAIDDYSIALMSLMLRAIAEEIYVYEQFSVSPSEMIIRAEDAVNSNSTALDYIEKRKLVSKELITAVKSKTPQIVGLTQIIAQNIISIEKRDESSTIQIVEINGKYTLADKDGKKITRNSFDKIWNFPKDGELTLVRSGEKYGYINKKGKIIISLKFDYATPFNEGVAAVSIGGKYGYISTSGKWEVEPIYDFARSVHDGVGEVEINGDIQYITVKK